MNLNYKSYGQGDPIIILHGLFGMLDNWQTIAKKLAENYTVFTIDQRNHGRSPHEPAMTHKIMAEDLQEFMEQQWIHKASVMGHSMGGKTAMQFALDFPEMVEKLIVVDIGPFSNNGGHELIFEALLSMDLKKIKSRKEADDFLSTKIPQFGVRQFLLKNLSRNKAGEYFWKMNLPVIYEHYNEILAKVEGNEPFEGDTLFIRGEKSSYINEEDFPAFKNIFPNAQLKTIENAGHWVHADAPDQLLKVTNNFLNN
jgi:pimeloyl-ACP methyl ester carboxylesterase